MDREVEGRKMRPIPLRWSGLTALVIGVAVALVPGGAVGAAARTVTVCPSGPPTCQYATIQEALIVVADGDRILVATGIYAGGFTIGKSVQIVGSGPDRTRISGGSVAVIVAAGRTVTIGNLTIRDATTTGLVNNGALTLRGVRVSGNHLSLTESPVGGVLNNGSLTLRESTVSDNGIFGNTVSPGIGGVLNNGRLVIQGGAVTGNGSSRVGAIKNNGTLTLRGTSVSGNGALADAAGIANYGTANLANCNLTGNDSDSAGGIANMGHLVVTNCVLSNFGEEVGGIANRPGAEAVIADTTFDNEGFEFGNIRNAGILTITNSTITGFTTNGESIWNTGTMTIRATRITNNRSDYVGGILNSGTMTIRDSTVSGNVGWISAGGIANSGDLQIAFSTVTHNTAGTDVYGAGGGISNEGNLLIVHSTISANTSARGGGIANSGSVTLRHSVVTENLARGDYNGVFGGGIYNSGTVVLRHSRVYGNIPDDCVGCGEVDALEQFGRPVSPRLARALVP
jgi:hypothetical protein